MADSEFEEFSRSVDEQFAKLPPRRKVTWIFHFIDFSGGRKMTRWIIVFWMIVISCLFCDMSRSYEIDPVRKIKCKAERRLKRQRHHDYKMNGIRKTHRQMAEEVVMATDEYFICLWGRIPWEE